MDIQTLLPSQPAASPPLPPNPLSKTSAANDPTIATEPAPGLPPAEVLSAYENMCAEIIKQQAGIISDKLALEQVQGIDGLSVDPSNFKCTLIGDSSGIIDDVVTRYSSFFGHAAVEVCRDAARRYITRLPPDQIPSLLK
jgi:hypothetical protein